MNKITLPLYVLFVMLSIPLSAQKMKDKRVDIRYVKLPTDKLPTDFTTYSVLVYGSDLSIAGMSSSSLANNIRMDGFKRVGFSPNEFGHLRISVNTGNMTSGQPQFKSYTTSSKNSKGVVTRSTEYWYEINCSSGTSWNITDPDGQVLASGSNSHADNISSRKYSSSSELSKNYSSIVSGIRRNFAASVTNASVSIANQALRNKYDFSYAIDDQQMYWIKKHVDEVKFEEKLDKTVALCKTFAASVQPADILKEMQPILDFWKKYADQKPGDDKDLQEVYIGTNYNLSVMSFYTDQFDAAMDYAKRILLVDDKEKRTKKWIEQMHVYTAQMEKLGLHTTHFVRDLTHALPPSKVKQLEEEKAAMQADNNSLSGFAVINGDTLMGTYVRDKDQSEFIFGPKGNTKFMVAGETEMKEYDLTASEVAAFMVGDRKFQKMNFAPRAKGKAEQAIHILEEIYGSDKVKLYKYYPASGLLANEPYEYAFQKKSDPGPVSLLDTQFLLFDKGMAAYFGDCADLKSLCEQGGFKMVEADLLKAARVYSEVCQ